MRWLRKHWFGFLAGLRLWADQPFSHLLNALVLSIALSLPWALFQGLSAVIPSVDRSIGDPEISIFFKLNATEAIVDQAMHEIQTTPSVTSVSIVDPKRAAEIMKAQSRSPELIDGLPSNPLPYTLIVRLKIQAETNTNVDQLVDGWKKLEGVEQVQFDSQWMRRLQSILVSARWIAIGLAAVIGVMVIIVTFNTVRLQLVSHTEEVTVLKALGATDGEVGRPILWWAMSLAVLAFGMAYGGVFFAMQSANEGAGPWLRQFDSQFAFTEPDPIMISSLAGIWALLVMIGAWTSVRKTVWSLR
jgi:cell division transport system permease protein